MDGLINRQAAIDILDDYQVMVENGEEKPYAWARLRMSELPSAQPDCIECLREIDNYGEEHYIGDDDKMFWDIRSILENPKHSESDHYGESTEIVRCKDCKHRDPEDKKCDSGHAIQWQLPRSDDWFCADAEMRTE